MHLRRRATAQGRHVVWPALAALLLSVSVPPVWSAPAPAAVVTPMVQHVEPDTGGADDTIRGVTTPPTGKRMAASAGGEGARPLSIWDVNTGQRLAHWHDYDPESANAPPASGYSSLTAVAFSPNSRWILTGSEDGGVKIWDGQAGKIALLLKGVSSPVHAVAFSPDAKLVAAGSDDGGVRVWDAASGQLVHHLPGHVAAVTALAFSPNGATLASSSLDGTYRLFDRASGKLLAAVNCQSQAVYALAFSRDGATLATASLDLRLWEVARGRLLTVLEAGRGFSERTLSNMSFAATPAFAVAFSPDSRWLAWSRGYSGLVRVYDLKAEALWGTLQGHRKRVTSLAFTPDGRRLATGSWDDAIRVWDVSRLKGLAQTLEVRTLTAALTATGGNPAIPGSFDGLRFDGVLDQQQVIIGDRKDPAEPQHIVRVGESFQRNVAGRPVTLRVVRVDADRGVVWITDGTAVRELALQ